MKKKLFQKSISLLLVVVMVLGMTLSVTATENNDESKGEESSSENIKEELSDSLVNYIAITSSDQQLSDSQQVVVGVGNGERNLKDGVLTYKNTSTNEIYQVNRDEKSDEALSFLIDYSNKSKGVYKLVGLEYTLDGKKYNLALQDIGLDASWGVGVDYDANPDAIIPLDNEDSSDPEEIADITFDVTTEDGKSATASTITEALEEAAGDLSIGSNGVVKTKSSYTEASSVDRIVSDTGLSTSSNDVKKTGAGNVVIVLDPGHGGSDSGATCNGLLEKDVNLKVAQYCKSALEQYGGVTVHMTRYGDYYVGLEERTAFAQSVGASAFVSIHMNSGGASGVEVWYPNGNYNPLISLGGYYLSEKILNNIAALGMNNRGLKIRNSESGTTYPDGSLADYYSVIRTSKERGFAGIIVEHAFMDGDYGRLCDENFLRMLGNADASGIAQFFNLSSENLAQYEGAFDVAKYRFLNPDLQGFNDSQLFEHWINYGIWENRDGSPVFNMQYYINNYPDLVNAFGWDMRAYARHFSQCGMSEGRRGNSEFNVYSYKNRYADLRNAFGYDLRRYYMHYVQCGFSEGRETKGYENKLVGSVTMYNGVDCSSVYDYNYYTSHYADMNAVFGNDDIAILKHFVECGMNEGRQAKASFSLQGYKNRYLDLRRAFGNLNAWYYVHYIANGVGEGRDASYTDRVVEGEHVFFGVDFSPVYDFRYYQDHNLDVKAAYGNDDVATFTHFLLFGINEGRRASANFDFWTYAINYADLRNAFGWNVSSYYLHYILNGRFEGRRAS